MSDEIKIRRLRDGEFIQVGDLVTIGDNEESGFREIKGCFGEKARNVSYPVYRDETNYKKENARLRAELESLKSRAVNRDKVLNFCKHYFDLTDNEAFNCVRETLEKGKFDLGGE